MDAWEIRKFYTSSAFFCAARAASAVCALVVSMQDRTESIAERSVCGRALPPSLALPLPLSLALALALSLTLALALVLALSFTLSLAVILALPVCLSLDIGKE